MVDDGWQVKNINWIFFDDLNTASVSLTEHFTRTKIVYEFTVSPKSDIARSDSVLLIELN